MIKAERKSTGKLIYSFKLIKCVDWWPLTGQITSFQSVLNFPGRDRKWWRVYRYQSSLLLIDSGGTEDVSGVIGGADLLLHHQVWTLRETVGRSASNLWLPDPGSSSLPWLLLLLVASSVAMCLLSNGGRKALNILDLIPNRSRFSVNLMNWDDSSKLINRFNTQWIIWIRTRHLQN